MTHLARKLYAMRMLKMANTLPSLERGEKSPYPTVIMVMFTYAPV
jgi:hypothetical protein